MLERPVTSRAARAALALLALGAAPSAWPATTLQPPRVWDFRVTLDDALIGRHRFTLRAAGAQRELTSEARFDVKVLFFTAYRYVHEATERWQGDCLESLAARTDDNGEPSSLSAARDGSRLAVVTAGRRTALAGCVRTFAYWNPAILGESRLLNAQTGAYENINVAALGESRIVVRGATVTASHYRITGSKRPIDLWYSPSMEWLALESTVEGGRRLRYGLH